jgi:hypothetical protein
VSALIEPQCFQVLICSSTRVVSLNKLLGNVIFARRLLSSAFSAYNNPQIYEMGWNRVCKELPPSHADGKGFSTPRGIWMYGSQ